MVVGLVGLVGGGRASGAFVLAGAALGGLEETVPALGAITPLRLPAPPWISGENLPHTGKQF